MSRKMSRKLTTWQRSSAFLDLPPEIRNRIYELILIQPQEVRIIAGHDCSSTRAVLCACRQTHKEATAIYYMRNTFGLETPQWFFSRHLNFWLRRIGGRKRAMLRDLRIWLVGESQLIMADKLSFLKEQNAKLANDGLWLPLEVLRIRVNSEYLHYYDLEVLAGEDCFKDVDGDYDPYRGYPRKGPCIREWKYAWDVWVRN